MNITYNTQPALESLAKLYPSELVAACGGEKIFNQLKILDCTHFKTAHGSTDGRFVTEPIMVGINSNQRPYIILTFDVYNAKNVKIAKKVVEVFHDDPCLYEEDLGVHKWQGIYRIYGSCGGRGATVNEISQRIQGLVNGEFIREPHRFNYGEVSYIKLWSKNHS